MAEKEDGKNASQEGRPKDLARKKARARGRWQGRNQNMLDVWQDRIHCSMVQEGGKMCTPSMTTTVKTLKNKLTTKKICKHGVSWKKGKMSSGKRWSADETSRGQRKPIKRHC